MNNVTPIEAVRLKLDRADRHLAELEHGLNAYYAAGPIHLEGHFDPDASQWVTIVRVNEEPPPNLGPVIGDIAHNLRSALDQLTWQLAQLATNQPFERTQFPILADADAWVRTGIPMLRSLRPEHAAFIELLQPYHDAQPEENLLYVLGRLSNVDKHREMHIGNTALMGASLNIGMKGGALGIGALHLTFGPLEDGSEVARIDVLLGEEEEPSPQFDVGLDGAFDLAVTDDDGTLLAVYAGLYASREYVGDLVDWFAPLL